MYEISRAISNLDLICIADYNHTWKKQFLKNELFDVLIKMYCFMYYKFILFEGYANDYLHALTLAKLLRILYWFCGIYLPMDVTSSVSMNNALKSFREHVVFGKELADKILEIKQNYLIGLIMIDAQLNVDQIFGILNVIPHAIGDIHCRNLIIGYVGRSLHIPQDIIELLSHFFF
eukprot:317551_1